MGRLWLSFWFWGCSRGCPGCGNQDCLDPKHRVTMEMEELKAAISGFVTGKEIYGLIATGGEPLEQPEALKALLLWARERSWYTLLFTGGSLEEAGDLTGLTDLLIDGPFMEELYVKHPLFGSSNQGFHVLNPDLQYLQDLKSGTREYTKSFKGNFIAI